MPAPPPGIVDALQAALKNHWTQILAYEAQAEHFLRWGYKKLAETFKAYSVEEHEHLRLTMARLEFYDVQPSYDFPIPEWPRHDFEGILQSNYDVALAASGDERSGYKLAVEIGDSTSADVFAVLLKGSEDAMAEIEAVRLVIDQIGIDNYLADQV